MLQRKKVPFTHTVNCFPSIFRRQKIPLFRTLISLSRKKVRITLKMTSPLPAPMWPPPGAGMHIINNYCNILSFPFYILNLDTVWVGIGVLVSKLMHLSMQMHVSYVPDRLRQSTSSAPNAVYQCPSSMSTIDHSFVARPGDISNTNPPRTHVSTPLPCPPADRRGRK